MTNKQVYRKTLTFSIRRFFYDLFSIILIGGLIVLGYLLGGKFFNQGLIGLVIGGIAGIIIVTIFMRYVSFKYKAGQIAMMTKGITEGELPDNVVAEGKRIVKQKLGTVAAYFAVTRLIKGIFNQVGRGLRKLGTAIGGDAGGAIGDTISSAVQTMINYLSDCCLAWVFYREDLTSTRATLEGAGIFFKHGKTLVKNMGRVFLMALASLLLIGGSLTVIFYFIIRQFPGIVDSVLKFITEANASGDGNFPDFMMNPTILAIVIAAFCAIIIWSLIHSLFVKPLTLVGVLRNFIKSGVEDMPDEAEIRELENRSPKFRKLLQKEKAQMQA